jgi:hypothetical protein
VVNYPYPILCLFFLSLKLVVAQTK